MCGLLVGIVSQVELNLDYTLPAVQLYNILCTNARAGGPAVASCSSKCVLLQGGDTMKEVSHALIEDVHDAIFDLVELIKTYQSKNKLSKLFMSTLFKRRQEELDAVVNQAVMRLQVSGVPLLAPVVVFLVPHEPGRYLVRPPSARLSCFSPRILALNSQIESLSRARARCFSPLSGARSSVDKCTCDSVELKHRAELAWRKNRAPLIS